MAEPSSALVEGVAGALGGVLGLAATYPLLAVNTRLQLQSKAAPVAAMAAAGVAAAAPAHGDEGVTSGEAQAPAAGVPAAAFPAPPPLPAAMLPALLHVVRAEGGGALFAGLGTACVSLAISNCVYYYLYALLRDAALRVTRRPALGGAAALPVAAAAGALNVLLTNPLWVLVVRLQAAERAPPKADVAGGERQDKEQPQSPPPASLPPPGPLALARDIYAEGGVRAFWKGTLPSLLMVSNPVVQFAAYEWIMARVLAANARTAGGRRPLPPAASQVFAAGAAAKLVATLSTYPFLVVKSRQQARRAGGATPAAQQRPLGPLAEAWLLAREEGIAGLYRGLDTKLAQTVLAAAILFTTKEQLTAATRRGLARLAAPRRSK